MSDSSSSPVLLNASLQPSASYSEFRTSNASKIDFLYEVSLSDDTKISETQLPLMNPYSTYARPSNSFSPLRSIKQLIRHTPKECKEYVQSSKFDQHPIPATEQEYFVTLQIPPDFPRMWIQQGYTHLHYGAVRLALTFHGRRGLPVVARMSLMDTRFLQYGHACIGSVQTTLNAGTVFVTLYPNFNVALSDPQLTTFLKVQLQLTGAPQVEDSVAATLHYQMVYRVQNHALDLCHHGNDEALFISLQNDQASCIHVPRQIPKDQLTKLLPESWVTNYEKLHQNSKPIQSSDSEFIRKKDGSVTIKFKKPTEEVPSPIFQTIMTIQPCVEPLSYSEDPASSLNRLIAYFQPDGRPVFHYKDDYGHCPWDIDCQCSYCLHSPDEAQWQIENWKHKKNKKKKKEDSFAQRFQKGDPSIDTLGECSKFPFLVSYSPTTSPPSSPAISINSSSERPDVSSTPVSPFYKPIFKWVKKQKQQASELSETFQKSTSEVPNKTVHPFFGMFSEKDFPPLSPSPSQIPPLQFPESEEFKSDHYTYRPLIPDSTSVDASGRSTYKITAGETVLNWQSATLLAQNNAFRSIDSKIDRVQQTLDHHDDNMKKMLTHFQKRLNQLESGANTGYHYWENPQPEIDKLKRQITMLQQGQVTHPSTIPPVADPFAFPLTGFRRPQAQPSPVFAEVAAQTFPKDMDLQAKYEEMKQKRSAKGKRVLTPADSSSSSPPEPHHMISNPLETFLKNMAIKDPNPNDLPAIQTAASTSSSSASADSPPSSPISPYSSNHSDSPQQIFMADDPPEEQMESDTEHPTPQQSTPPISSSTSFFTLDDIPFHKWPERVDHFHSWLNLRALTQTSHFDILTEFTTKFTGSLKHWWQTLTEQDQMTFLLFPDFVQPIHLIYRYFIGKPSDLGELKRREYFDRKCCSLQKRHLDKHYAIMARLFYALGADPNLKQVFLNSVPPELSQLVERNFLTRGQKVTDTPFGELQQELQTCLDDLCLRRSMIRNYLANNSAFDKACSRQHLKIKCPKGCDGTNCGNHTKKQTHVRTFKHHRSKHHGKKRKWRFFRKKQRKDGKRHKSARCFGCKKKGHFLKDCPQGKRLLHHIQEETGISLHENDVESLFSEDDGVNEDTLCIIPIPSSDSDDMFHFAPPSSPLPPISSITHCPHFPVKLYLSKFDKPISVIALIDTGASASILDTKILPKEFWKPCTKYFNSASGDTFSIRSRSTPVTIQFFPSCSVRTTLLGSSLPNKDLVIGWDIISQLPHLRIIPGKGLRYKHYYSDFVDIQRYFSIQLNQFDPSYQRLLHACADNHSEFAQKCTHPLWHNPEFFVRLPFIKTEDVTPTKASHPGMSPDHTTQVLQECAELLQHKLIEPSSSQWSCEAFYVNKRSEQNRGKLRLVINYQPLNHFLQDDKFPLPSRNSLFLSLSQAKIYSKFDLKAGFWQLGIHPDDRFKTGFCIPSHHYQWRVLPFGLKVAPSLFQKAMCKIFAPLLHSAAIYIDDILLYSPDAASHQVLLDQFSELVEKYGIMLSQKKMVIAQQEIEFLGMHLKDGTYYPGPHIAAELLKFPDKDLTVKEVQQFLGIINYLRDFVPHIAKLLSPLQQMLKKNPPPWSQEQTKALSRLKEIMQDLPPLHIPSTGKRILQTDASDEYWAAILFEEINGKRKLCGYKSGKFSNAEMHYHSTFKEILAVKKGIKKFEFHLIGHKFLIEMDMASFPQMLKFKQKQIPHSQLLRWSEWFSKFSYESVHISGKKNFLADFLSRPRQTQDIHMYIRTRPPPSEPDKYNISRMNDWPSLEYPPDIIPYIQQDILQSSLHEILWRYHHQLFQQYGGCWLKYGLNTKYPFIHPLQYKENDFPEMFKWFLWYFCNLFFIAIEFPTIKLIRLLSKMDSRPHLLNSHEQNLQSFFTWFYPIAYWRTLVTQSSKEVPDEPHRYRKHTVVFFHRPWTFSHPSGILSSYPSNRGTTTYRPQPCYQQGRIYKTFPGSAGTLEHWYRELQRVLCQENRVIPEEAWDYASPVSWDHEPISHLVMTALQEYREQHSSQADSSSQDTPMEQHSARDSDPWGGPLAQNPFPDTDLSLSTSSQNSIDNILHRLRDPTMWPQPRIPSVSPDDEFENLLSRYEEDRMARSPSVPDPDTD